MCIDLKTSIMAFLIGEISGLILASYNDERRAVGLFIMFFSLVQLCEAVIYFIGNDDSTLVSRLLLINLGLQGLVFFFLANYFINVNPIYFIITGIISIYITFTAISKDFKSANVISCMRWHFLNNETIFSLLLMYIMVFAFTLSSHNIIFTKTAIIFLITLFLSGLFQEGPSYWCLLSALAAPLIIIT